MKSALRIQFSVPKYAGNHETGTSSIKIGNIRRLVPRLKSLHLNGETSSSPRISQIRKSHARVSPIKFFQFFQLLKILARRWKDALLRNKSQKGDILEYPNFPSCKMFETKNLKNDSRKAEKAPTSFLPHDALDKSSSCVRNDLSGPVHDQTSLKTATTCHKYVNSRPNASQIPLLADLTLVKLKPILLLLLLLLLPLSKDKI